ncbi:hypothetical protein [Myxococcus xanthus]|uniref:StkC n=1 Tax=Myxococcus xanthus TaxID=34 RepID=A0AAE6KSU5_MYXXA|nr:hypothetical protein [Myxococcus xanthus]QDE68559.1 hypothetical protein BHS09_17080 [Myxococcus xanthus]QDE75836.1 hypothetical protein BHS08_17095 [Myxococcus xanthus]QDE83163.1 hypothetical protein BHS07_17250 [Myxococcus xanthus]QDE97403.1 hypothetical protein BHS05_16980 [Myxococcus xanthus]QDF04981.1 hypothetical protein BHS04_17480 [Myxococcus xanthus]
MGITDDLKKQALNVSGKAMEKLMADDRRAMAIANAIGKAQRGKQALDRGQEELMKALNFAPRSEFKALGKQLSGLKRRLRELDEKLGAL